MLVDYKRKLYEVESASGKNGADSKVIDSPGKNGEDDVEVDEEYQQIVDDVQTNRETILNEGSEDEPGTKKPGEEDDSAGKPDEEIKDEDKPLPDELEITEDFINQETFAKELKFDDLDAENVKEALNSIKGKKIDKDVLKNFVHTQVTLLDYKAGKHQPEKDVLDEPAEKVNIDVTLDTEGLTEDEITNVNNARAQALYTRLKPKYKDITLEDLENKESVNSYISSMNINNPLDADDFKLDFRSENAKIVTAVNEYKDVSTNWPTKMRSDATEMIGKFEGYLGKKELKMTDLGKELDESYVINKILKNDKGELKEELITYYRDNKNIPMIDKDKFYQALVDHFDGDITSFIEKRGVNTFIDNKKNKEANPSISESGLPGEPKEAAKTVIPDDMVDFDEMDKILAENRKKILKSDGSTY